MTLPIEYRLIIGFPLYRVGNDGSVWTRICGGATRRVGERWRRLKGHTNRDGYKVITLYRHLGGKVHTLSVHRLVLEAFVGPCPEGMECRHGPDHDKLNNNLMNLRWGTHQENVTDSVLNGRHTRGSNQPQAKLTEDDIPIIRQLAADGMAKNAIAAKFKVHPNTIGKIVRREKWKHVM